MVDALARGFDAVVRFQGGANAGHTVVVGGVKRIFHLVPSGVLQGKLGVIGSGVVIDTEVLLEEVESLRSAGVEPRLLVSKRAHVTTKLHRLQDELEEEARGGGAVGTTRRGIGPTYADKASRVGLRVGDLLDAELLRSRLAALYELKRRTLGGVYGRADLPGFEDLYRELLGHGAAIGRFAGDAEYELNRILSKGGSVLFEGAQGTLLDLDHGTYPYVTSSNTTAAAAAALSGVPPSAITKVLGVAKAYATRVGGGPFPTEDKGEEGKLLRELGSEYGATTGRPRRCGWFDAVLARYSAMINGVSAIALTKLDVLSAFSRVKIAVGYKLDGAYLDEVPSTAEELGRAQPVYEEMEGWKGLGNSFWEGAKARGEGALPRQVRAYISRIEELVGAPVGLVSYGPSREELVDLGLGSVP